MIDASPWREVDRAWLQDQFNGWSGSDGCVYCAMELAKALDALDEFDMSAALWISLGAYSEASLAQIASLDPRAVLCVIDGDDIVVASSPSKLDALRVWCAGNVEWG